MKKLMSIVLVAVTLAACNNKYKASSENRADSIKMMKDSLSLDSFKRAEADKVKAKEEAKRQVETRTVVVNHYDNTPSHSTTTTTTTRKKGWSSAAKGAVIGGAAGAIGGALIDKKHGQGAIIGGVAGAGAGYLIGRGKDKKTGRAN
jgi:hypothetical protein